MSEEPVASDLLDAAESVYNLTMNGGLDHAYEVVGEQFPAAAGACDAIGAVGQASALREVLALLANDDHAGTREGRSAAIRNLNSEQEQALQALNDRFCAAEDLMERLETAAEA